MPKTAQNTAIAALLALGSFASIGHAGGNPWNPNPTAPQPAAPQLHMPKAPVEATPQAQPMAPSRFAPDGLEQQLAAAPLAQYASKPEVNAPANTGTTPPRYAPQNTRNTGAPQQYAPAQQGPGNPYYRGFQQNPGYGGYPQGYGPYGNQGFNNNGNGPFGPFGVPSIPGGFGTNFPIPGNITNGGVPGFNMTPFGLF